MSESPADMIERVRLMADGSPTWDLSDNDCAALRYVLRRIAELEALLRDIDMAVTLATGEYCSCGGNPSSDPRACDPCKIYGWIADTYDPDRMGIEARLAALLGEGER